eukprot:XP_024999233.1 zinc transporter ZIP1 isoform X2 [Gallus gallus]
MAVGSGPGVAALSWSPGAARTPPGRTELQLKLGAVAALLLLPLCCGLGALCCVRGPRAPLQFPLPEFLLAMGFLLVLVLEHAALALRDRPAGAEEDDGEDEEGADRALLTAAAPPAPPGRPSPLRAGLLVVALVLHGALEGLALGLQEPGGAALRLCVALLLHKGLVAFGLALQLLRGRLRRSAVAAALLLFSLASPLGAAVGAAVEAAAGGGPRQRLGRSVAEGMAAGAFLYVTLLEVLPRELGGGAARLRVPKVLALLGGFALVTATLFIRV